MVSEIGGWIAAFCVLMILSLLWKENRVYRIGESLLLGLTVGFTFAISWFEFLKPKWWDPWTQNLATIGSADIAWTGIVGGAFALALGLCWYGMYFKKTEWVMRLVLGVVIGAGAGQAIKNQFTQQMPVVTASFRSPIVIQEGSVSAPQSINNTIFLVALISVMIFFLFSIDHKSAAMRAISRSGRFWLMIGFGAYFGNTVMTRLSALIERVWFVVQQFTGMN